MVALLDPKETAFVIHENDPFSYKNLQKNKHVLDE